MVAAILTPAMPALWLWLLFGLVSIGLRVALHMHRTGESGLRGFTGRVGSIEWLAGIGFVASIALGVAAPVLAATDVVEPIDALDTTAVHASGLVLYGLGLVGVAAAQHAMGRSWRVGVDPSERTELVTGGLFANVRNPIYSAMLAVIAGLAMLVPSVVALASVALLIASLEAQTRLVEEPYLSRTHPQAYRDYARRVGRFLPGLGKLD